MGSRSTATNAITIDAITTLEIQTTSLLGNWRVAMVVA